VKEFLYRSHANDEINTNKNPMTVEEWKYLIRSNGSGNPARGCKQTEFVIEPIKSFVNPHNFKRISNTYRECET